MKKYLPTVITLICGGGLAFATVPESQRIREGHNADQSFTIVAQLNTEILKTYLDDGNPGRTDSLIVGRTSQGNILTGLETGYLSASFSGPNTISDSGLYGRWDRTSMWCEFSSNSWSCGTGTASTSWDGDLCDLAWDKVASGAIFYTWDTTPGSSSYGTTAGILLLDDAGMEVLSGFTRNSKLISSGKSLHSLSFGESIMKEAIFYYSEKLSGADALVAARSIAVIPEPSTFSLLAGLGALGLGFVRRRRIQSCR